MKYLLVGLTLFTKEYDEDSPLYGRHVIAFDAAGTPYWRYCENGLDDDTLDHLFAAYRAEWSYECPTAATALKPGPVVAPEPPPQVACNRRFHRKSPARDVLLASLADGQWHSKASLGLSSSALSWVPRLLDSGDIEERGSKNRMEYRLRPAKEAV